MKAGSGALAAAVAAGLGAVVGTIWIGSSVKEETVVGNPYEEGLRQDADRRARAEHGWDVRVEGMPSAPGRGELRLAAVDREGRPLDGAALTVFAHRADTSRGAVSAEARPTGPGTFAVDVELPAAGAWVLRFDVTRGGERVRVEKTVTVGDSTPTSISTPTPTPTTNPTSTSTPCSVADRACTLPLATGGEVTLDLGPRPLRTMAELAVSVDVRGAPGATSVDVSFEMPGMDMGPNVSRLAPAEGGRFGGKGVLVRCPSGRRDWTAEVRVSRAGAPAARARFPFTLAE